MTRETRSPAIRLYGAAWCADCRRAKSWFAHHGLAYEEIDLEREPERRAEIEAMGYRAIPVIVLPDGRTLVEPSNDELYEAFLPDAA